MALSRPQHLRRILRRTAFSFLLLYVGFGTILCWQERAMLYLPSAGPSEPSDIGLDDFSRRELLLDRTVADGFFTEQFSATNRVVITGAQTLLSAELSGGGFNTGQRD